VAYARSLPSSQANMQSPFHPSFRCKRDPTSTATSLLPTPFYRDIPSNSPNIHQSTLPSIPDMLQNRSQPYQLPRACASGCITTLKVYYLITPHAAPRGHLRHLQPVGRTIHPVMYLRCRYIGSGLVTGAGQAHTCTCSGSGFCARYTQA
jgi:hypothetical protein